MRFGGVSVRDALDSAMIAFGAAGVDTPGLDAEVLLAHALGVDRAALVLDPERPVEGESVRAFQRAVRRRSVEREPVAYIVGRRGFRHLELLVDRRVLIPRPETELLVEAALTLADRRTVIDVGTGSGAVALALKDERPDLDVFATDVSLEAIEVARANASRLGLEVTFVHADLLEGVPEGDAVIANPPYIEPEAILQPEITRHEPAVALWGGGSDGTGLARRLIEQVLPTKARFLALEVGEGQAQLLAGVARKGGFTEVRVLRDLAGVERVLVAER